MAHTMQFDNAVVSTSMDRKTYPVNFKGLIKHLMDILSVESHQKPHYHAADLSAHLQRDIGLIR